MGKCCDGGIENRNQAGKDQDNESDLLLSFKPLPADAEPVFEGMVLFPDPLAKPFQLHFVFMNDGQRMAIGRLQVQGGSHLFGKQELIDAGSRQWFYFNRIGHT